LKHMDNGSTYSAQWFNPRNGEYKEIATFAPTENRWDIPDRPTAEDWVLLVRIKAANRAAVH